VRALTGWGDTQCRVHLERLTEMEYLLAHHGRRGQVFEYEFLYAGEGEEGDRFLMGLADLPTVTTATSRGSEAKFAGSSRGQNGPNAGPSRTGAESREARQEATSQPIPANGSKKARLPQGPTVLSYPHPSLAA
jgi:hypothetical protein